MPANELLAFEPATHIVQILECSPQRIRKALPDDLSWLNAGGPLSPKIASRLLSVQSVSIHHTTDSSRTRRIRSMNVVTGISDDSYGKPASRRLPVPSSGFGILGLMVAVLSISTFSLNAQSRASSPPSSDTPAQADAGTSTDLFVMVGSDFDRPGVLPRANYNIGIGHTFGFLKKVPIGDELTFGYTYENAGSHGFLHTADGEHTESVGVMKNFLLPKTKVVTGYTWLQSGVTSYTGHPHVQNRLDSGISLGAI